MKLADITAAATTRFPNLETDVPSAEGEVQVVFRNIILMGEEDRARFQNIEAEVKKAADSKKKESGIRKEANLLKDMLARTLADPSQIELLEAEFAKDPHSRDANWLLMWEAYQEQTQLGEAGPSRKG